MDNLEIREMTKAELDYMVEEEMHDRANFKLSDDDLEPLLRYTEQHIRTGGFLESVLKNDLKEAVWRADMHNRRKIFEYVEWLYNHAPKICWGSEKTVEAWIGKRSEAV